MLKIEHWGNGFKVIYVGQRWSVKAQNIEELHLAIDHYYLGYSKHDRAKCPTCRKLAKKGE